MELLYVVQRYLPAPLTGSERYVEELSSRFSELGHKVSVIASNAYHQGAFVNPLRGIINKRDDYISGVKVRRLRIGYEKVFPLSLLRLALARFNITSDILNLLTSGPLLPGLFKVVRNSDCDLIHATPFPYSMVYYAWLASRKVPLPFVVTPFFHPELEDYYSTYLAALLSRSEGIIAMTEFERKKLISLGARPKTVYVVPMGIDVSEWEKANGDRFKRKHGLQNYHIVLYVNPKLVRKGAFQVLESMRLVEKRRGDVALVTIGPSNRRWVASKRLLRKTKLVDLEWLDGQEKRDAFDACDMFVSPSKVESFGRVYLEAWMRQKPVIGARVGPMCEVIRDGVDGYLVDFGDSLDLARKIQKLINSTRLREELGRNGMIRVVERNDWRNLITRVHYVYEEAMARLKNEAIH